jgi:hypothetical protein
VAKSRQRDPSAQRQSSIPAASFLEQLGQLWDAAGYRRGPSSCTVPRPDGPQWAATCRHSLLPWAVATYAIMMERWCCTLHICRCCNRLQQNLQGGRSTVSAVFWSYGRVLLYRRQNPITALQGACLVFHPAPLGLRPRVSGDETPAASPLQCCNTTSCPSVYPLWDPSGKHTPRCGSMLHHQLMPNLQRAQ